ncbi:hypothetical protein OH77DRAFT_1491054, partial [Trametes cingulata]
MARRQQRRVDTSFRAISRWNKTVRQSKPSTSSRQFARGLLYPTDGSKPRSLLVPIHDDVDLDGLPRCWLQDLNFEHWFPLGSRSERIREIPGLDFSLRNHYTLVRDAHHRRSMRNRSLQVLGVRNVRGNLLLIRHAARNCLEVTDCKNP